jgi:hypothetical protein
VSTEPDTHGDHYIELMRDSRGLSASRNEAREQWYNALEQPTKEEILFELELLLKGVVCFGNLQNHPGPRRREPEESRQFHEELRVAQLAFERIAALAEQLVPPIDDRSASDLFVSSGPLEHVSRPLLDEPADQDTPERSLRLLHRAFSNLADVVGVMSRLDVVAFRGFEGIVQLAGREIGRNAFFNPLRSIEFRPEYDHLQHIEILHIVYGGGPEGAQRAATLAFLGLFRMLRYMRYADAYLLDPSTAQLACIPLAVARSDGQELSVFMRQESRRWLSSGFEREVMTLTAKEIVGAADGLIRDYRLLHDLGTVLRTTGDKLLLELRRAFEQKLQPLPELLDGDFQDPMRGVVQSIREVLMQAVVRIAQVFKPELEGARLFEDYPDERTGAERLRRDIWMFSQIVRGFLAKAQAAPETANRWTGQSSYRFVRDFIVYFRTLGYGLVERSAYERFEELLAQVESLGSAEVIDQASIEAFVLECEGFQSHLQATFDAIGTEGPLAGIAFDRHDAAETLRLYLDHG